MSTDRQIITSRIFDAPPERVSMLPPGSPSLWWGKFVFREVTPTERLCYVSGFSDADGGSTRPPFAPTFPLEVFNLLTLEDVEGAPA
jgi:uncharacterized protein YndB with AHSA1/START domain